MALADFYLPASMFVGDGDAQLVAGDDPCGVVAHNGAMALSFPDGSDESAAVSQWVEMPSAFASGTLKGRVFYYAESATSGDFDLEGYLQAVTPGSDTLDLEAATSWDSANQADLPASGTAGDLLYADVTFTNKDGVAPGDLFRLGLRRDSDDATDDDATGAMFIAGVRLFEE